MEKVKEKRVKIYLALGIVSLSFCIWLFPSNVVELIAERRHVLLGRYSVEWFSILFFLTPILWLVAYALWASMKLSGKQVAFRVVALVFSVILATLAIHVLGQLIRKPRYIEKQVSVHPATPDGHSVVSNSEMSNFSQGQGNQGIVRRRTFATSHKRSSRLTPKLRKRAISGWKQVKFRKNWPGERVHDVVRHRPPNSFYKNRYTDAPPTARSYPDPPAGYPTVGVTLTTDARGYRNLTSLEQYDIVTMGDSFTEGSRVSDDEPWPVLLGKKLNRSVYNLGISRGRPDYYLNTFRAFGLDLKPKVAIFMIYEGNDFKGVRLEKGSSNPGQPLGKRIEKAIKYCLQVCRARQAQAALDKRIEKAIKYSPIVMGFKTSFIKYLGPINADSPVRGAEILSWMPVAVPPGPGARYYAFKPKRLMRLYWTECELRQSFGWTSTAKVFEMMEICDREATRLVFAYAPSKPHVVMPLVKKIFRRKICTPLLQSKNAGYLRRKSSRGNCTADWTPRRMSCASFARARASDLSAPPLRCRAWRREVVRSITPTTSTGPPLGTLRWPKNCRGTSVPLFPPGRRPLRALGSTSSPRRRLYEPEAGSLPAGGQLCSEAEVGFCQLRK